MSEPEPHSLLNHQFRIDQQSRQQQLWIDVYEIIITKPIRDEAEYATHCANDALAEFNRAFSLPEKEMKRNMICKNTKCLREITTSLDTIYGVMCMCGNIMVEKEDTDFQHELS